MFLASVYIWLLTFGVVWCCLLIWLVFCLICVCALCLVDNVISVGLNRFGGYGCLLVI